MGNQVFRIRRALIAAAIAAVASTFAVAAPKLEIDSEKIDLGTAVRGEELSARFVLRNSGNEDLRILRAKPG